MERHGSSGSSKSLLVKAGNLLAVALAAAATFVGTGPFHGATVDMVEVYAAEQYGTTTAEIIGFVWGPFAALLLFSLSFAVLAIGFKTLAFWIRETLG